MPAEKLTPQLRESLSGKEPDALIDVIVECSVAAPTASPRAVTRGNRIAQQRQQFLDGAAPVEQRIKSLGGTVLEHAWINQTLRARVSVQTLQRLADDKAVVSIDVPARLTRE